MSSTGRNPRGGNGVDYFGTPAWCVHRLLEKLNLPGGTWLEPGAGSGAIIRAVNEKRSDVAWSATELNPNHEGDLREAVGDTGTVHIRDFLDGDPGRVDVVIGNPPFAHAMEFVQQAMRSAPLVAMLLRVGFLETPGRHDFFSAHMPELFIFPQRPSFDSRGTDSATYAWFVWGENPWPEGQPYGRVTLLDLTPKAERKRKR